MGAPGAFTVSPTWRPDIGRRLRYRLVLKVVGVTACTWLFFIAYFHLLRHPAYAVTVMPLTALDGWIAFMPPALFAYVTLWLYVGLGPGLQLSLRELVVYTLWIGALCLTGLVAFYFWPTRVPPLALETSGFPGFAMLQGVDATGNACPSMHVAVAVFTAVRIDEVLRTTRTPASLRLFNAAWFVAIAFSTVAIKQHVVLDVVAGALLGLAFVLPSMRWRPSPACRHGADIIRGRNSQAVPPARTTTDTAP